MEASTISLSRDAYYTSGTMHGVIIALSTFDAFLFDLDGVITRTAELHAAAWKTLFDEYLVRPPDHRRNTDRNVRCKQRPPHSQCVCAVSKPGTGSNEIADS